MITKPLKKIWLICLWISSLCLVWCFHIPDEDWLPSRNKVKTEDVKNDGEVEQAINSLVDWIDMISSEWDEKKNNEINSGELSELKNNDEEVDDIDIEDEIFDNENLNQEIENITFE